MKSPNVDLFIFDEGGVMIRDFYVVPAMAERMGLGEKELIALLRPGLAELSSGACSGEEFWRRFAARTGIVAGEDYFASLFDPRPDPESFALAEELARDNRVVCGTNTIESHHETNLRRGLYAPFHAVYASHILGKVKPDPEFWLHILRAEGVEPGRAFFVDDSPTNVEAARGLGIRSELFGGARALREVLEGLGALQAARTKGL